MKLNGYICPRSVFQQLWKIFNKYVTIFLNKTSSQLTFCVMLLDFNNSRTKKNNFIFTFINDLSAEYILFSGSWEALCTHFTLNTSSCSSSQLMVYGLVFYRTDIAEKYYHFVIDCSFKWREVTHTSLFFPIKKRLFLCPSVCVTLIHFAVVTPNHLPCHIMLTFISTLDRLQRLHHWKLLWKYFGFSSKFAFPVSRV